MLEFEKNVENLIFAPTTAQKPSDLFFYSQVAEVKT